MKIQCVPIKVGTDIRLLWPFLGHLTFSGPKTKKEITFRSEIHSDGLKSWLGKQALRNSCELLRRRKELHTSSWNCTQAHKTSFKVMELHVRSSYCMQAHETSCKVMELHVSSGNCMQANGPACKLMQLHVSLYNCMQVYVTACKLM